MSPANDLLAQRHLQLRRDFDRSFAEPARNGPAELTDLLAIRVGDHPYAVRLSDISGLVVDRPATPLPGSVPELLGVAGLRGSIVPVYDLAALLGHPAAPAPRWSVLAAGTPPVALAFDSVEGHLRVPPEAIAAAADREGPDATPRAPMSEVVRTAAGVRVVVNVPAVRAAVTARTDSQ